MNEQQSNIVITPEAMAKAIDHTVLKPDAVPADLEVLANEAVTHGFCAVCVNSCHVALVGEHLKGSDVGVCTVVGFPLGAMHPKAKAYEAETAVDYGASEIDMVLNVGALKSGKFKIAERDILGVRQAIGSGRVLKVIIETCLLTDTEKVSACKIAESAGADFVKTSTGFSSGGATMEDVRLMKQTIGASMQVKASGGIKNWHTAAEMLKAGATRIGTSSGVTILQDLL
ncbi:MAG: deoxyribose-phosphate aldolase [Thermodesulfobacteriota bacterium]